MSRTRRLAAAALATGALLGAAALPASASDGGRDRDHRHEHRHDRDRDRHDRDRDRHDRDRDRDWDWDDRDRDRDRDDRNRDRRRGHGLVLRAVQYDSPGPDLRTDRSLNGEWVLVKNTSRERVRLGGYTLDWDGRSYRFGRMTLRGGEEVKVHTGHGRDNRDHVYQDRDRHQFDNRSGRITLRDDDRFVDRCNWDRWDDGRVSC
ncbi:lamin tail domain-containing protein [Streptomyces sp. NPDC059637]|uniref:lamin tail domain-containing protein n=1 Tax=Streptomyces sp. NPDC059637 TaxID=3347752 RepID=UPI00368392EB